MKIIRYILSHSLLIGIIIALVAGFYYRPLLLPDSWNDYLDKRIGQVSPRLLSFQAASPKDEESETPAMQAEPTVVEEDTTPPPVVEATAPLVPESPVESFSQEQTGSETQAAEEAVAVLTVPSSEVDDEVEVSSRDQEQSEAQRLFMRARVAFADGDMAAAEQHYLEITSQETDDPDAFGELGNVYYAQGKWQEAGEAYFEAANRLLEQDQPAQLNYLVRVIQGLAPEKADKLREKMKQKGQ